MNYDLIFQLSNNLALLSWILLIAFPYKNWTPRWLLGITAGSLSVLYTALALSGFNTQTFADFGSLSGIMQLFTQPKAVLAGWVHYLAFDLMVGLYIASNARKLDMHRLILTPTLLFTFLLGPVGLLLFLIYRLLITKKLIKY